MHVVDHLEAQRGQSLPSAFLYVPDAAPARGVPRARGRPRKTDPPRPEPATYKGGTVDVVMAQLLLPNRLDRVGGHAYTARVKPALLELFFLPAELTLPWQQQADVFWRRQAAVSAQDARAP